MRISLLLLVMTVTLLGCGSADTSAPNAAPGSDGGLSAGAGSQADAGVDGGTSDAGTVDAGSFDAGPLPLPTITSVVVVTHGSIRVQWTNPAPACDSLKVTRSKDAATAVLAGQPAVGVVEFNDAPGHASGTYCYRLDCTRGGASSGLSNQACATQ